MKPIIRPTLITDSREQAPLRFTRFPSITAGLRTGDYSVLGAEELFCVERKSLDDLAACCSVERSRFENELHRARGYRFARLLIIGSEEAILRQEYRSRITPKAVLSTIAAFEIRYVPAVFTATPESAAALVEKWAYWFCYEQLKIDQSLFVEQPNQPEAIKA